MRINKISYEKLDTEVPVYDMVDVNPYHNYELATNTRDRYIISHNSVLERINSRFIVNGRKMGRLYLVSSTRSDYDFIESYIRKQQGKPGIYIVMARIWEVKPTGTYSGKTFNLAIGGSNLPSKVLEDNEDIREYERIGYNIMEVPIEFKSRFEMDMITSLQNIAGVSISGVMKFIPYPTVSQNYHDIKNPFTCNILRIGLKDSQAISDYFQPELIQDEFYTRPIFIHIDASVSGDRTGISAIAVMGYTYRSDYDVKEGKYIPTKKMLYRHIFSIGIESPPNDEISFQKTRDFIYYLKHILGWNIKGVSNDGFNGFDNRQNLQTMGFDASLVSVDRTPDAYVNLKSAMAEERIALIEIPELEFELVNLNRDSLSGKIDHDPEKSKDISDSLAGALYNASLHEKDLDLYTIDNASVFIDSNANEDSIDYGNRILSSLVTQSVDMNINDDESSIIDTSRHTDNTDKEKIRKLAQEILSSMSGGDKISIGSSKKTEENKISGEKDKNDEEEKRRRFLEAKRRRNSYNVSNKVTNHIQDSLDLNDGFLL